jgi:methylenetetrahydrofolate reductase (NADPH)
MTIKSVSIELVAREWETLKTQFSEISSAFPQITVVNIPDLLRFEIRSWEACEQGQKYFSRAIPHLRAVDFNLRDRFALAETLQITGITSVLIVCGDQPQDLSKRVYRNTSLELIRVLKKELPEIKIYAAIDPYRSSLQAELDYAHAKMEAGAEGFFTQPFYDLRLLEIYMENMEYADVFWGISPVTTETSKSYWETKNSVVFPKNFKADMAWNIKFAKQMMKLAANTDGNIYFMPIRIEPVKYLQNIFSEKNDEQD